MNAISRSLIPGLLCVLWLDCVPFLAAQSPSSRIELLALVPDDFAVSVVMNDLRGQSRRWESSGWFKAFRQSPLIKILLEAPELQQLGQWEKDLKKHFDLDWPSLRDDILGDQVLLSYSPGPTNQPQEERGLFLLHTRNPERLQRFIDQLNEAQKKSGELKSLTTISYRHTSYIQRIQGKKTQYYVLEGSVLAISPQEKIIRTVLERTALPARETPWTKRFQKAGAEQAFITLCVNPRALDSEFLKHAGKEDGFPRYWKALEGIFLTLSIHDEAELTLALQANPAALPKWIRDIFTGTSTPSVLWRCFPENSIITLASRTSFADTSEALQMLMPPKDRKNLTEEVQRNLGALMGMDVFKDLLPNIGPDWGVCVFPSRDPQQLPQTLAAIAIQPGTKDPPVDQAFFKAVQFFAGLALLEYNKNHPDPIRMQTIKQERVEVLVLRNEKFFPQGIEPACALKEGFLLFATSPEAILQFHMQAGKVERLRETLLLHLSTQELAKILRQRSEVIVRNLKQRHQMPESEARKNLISVLALLEQFERIQLSQHANHGQSSWTLRITPALPAHSPR